MDSLSSIFKTFFKIGATSFGGGYAMVLVIQREVVERRKWLPIMEFISMLGLAQSAPGPMVINTAIMIGYKLRGVKGAITAALGALLPSFFVMLIVAIIFGAIEDNDVVRRFFMGVRPAIAALILTSAILFANRLKRWSYIVVLASAAAIYFGISPLYLIGGAIIFGVLYTRSKILAFKRGGRR